MIRTKTISRLTILVSQWLLSCGHQAEQIDAYTRISTLTNLDAIKRECLIYKEQLMETKGPTIRLGKDTSIAIEYYKIRIYPGLSHDQIISIEKQHNFPIPNLYKAFLSQMNGAFINDIALYGLPSTWLKSGRINRAELEPLNIFTANSQWKYEHELDADGFLFGSAAYDSSENKQYLIIGDSIVCSRENGTIINRWATLNEMLTTELNQRR